MPFSVPRCCRRSHRRHVSRISGNGGYPLRPGRGLAESVARSNYCFWRRRTKYPRALVPEAIAPRYARGDLSGGGAWKAQNAPSWLLRRGCAHGADLMKKQCTAFLVEWRRYPVRPGGPSRAAMPLRDSCVVRCGCRHRSIARKGIISDSKSVPRARARSDCAHPTLFRWRTNFRLLGLRTSHVGSNSRAAEMD